MVAILFFDLLKINGIQKYFFVSTKCDIFTGKFHWSEEMYFQIYIACSRCHYNKVQVSICYHETLTPKSVFRIFTDHQKLNE